MVYRCHVDSPRHGLLIGVLVMLWFVIAEPNQASKDYRPTYRYSVSVATWPPGSSKSILPSTHSKGRQCSITSHLLQWDCYDCQVDMA